MIRKINYLLIALLLTACGGQKSTTVIENLPAWVQKKPIEYGYYTGIGNVLKTPGNTNYMATAKNDALADLASEISLNISTSSVLNQFESSLGYTEDFTAATKMATQEQLEGYELVNTFESPTHYYVQYRLSKQLHAELKEKRKIESQKKAVDFLAKAAESKANLRYYDAIANYVKGLESVIPYLSESLEVMHNGQTIYLGNELFRGIIETVSDIRILPKKNQLTIKNGASIGGDDLHFRVENKNNNGIEGLPIIFSLGMKPLRNNKLVSDFNGTVSYTLNQLKSITGSEQFIASLDANTMASQLASDPVFRKMLRTLSVPEGKIHIKIENPVFYIETIEKNLDEPGKQNLTLLKIKQILANNGFPVLNEKMKADYVIVLNANTSTFKTEGKMHYVKLNGTLQIFNNQKKLLFVEPFNEITGVQLNDMDAGLDAYNQLGDYLNRNFMTKLNEAIK